MSVYWGGGERRGMVNISLVLSLVPPTSRTVVVAWDCHPLTSGSLNFPPHQLQEATQKSCSRTKASQGASVPSREPLCPPASSGDSYTFYPTQGSKGTDQRPLTPCVGTAEEGVGQQGVPGAGIVRI